MSIEVEVALPDITRIRDDSSAFWPEAAHSLIRSQGRYKIPEAQSAPELAVITPRFGIWRSST